MRLANDDSLSAVDSVFLGPRGWSLPFRVRYCAYGVGLVVFLALLVLARRAGIGFGFTTFAYLLLATVAVTTTLLTRVTPERPIRTLLVTFVQEVAAPRPPTGCTATLRPPATRGARNRKARDARRS